jgi:hypothetical protein
MVNPVSLRRRGIVPLSSVPVTVPGYDLVRRPGRGRRRCGPARRVGRGSARGRAGLAWTRRLAPACCPHAPTPTPTPTPPRPQVFNMSGMANIEPRPGAALHGIVHRVTLEVRPERVG